MFGYIGINRPELKVRDLETYQAFYCGLCHTLKKTNGRFGQLTLTYDMTFLTILLNGLYESPLADDHRRCPLHPRKRMRQIICPESSYTSDMNVLLAAYNLEDDWRDDHSIRGLLMYRLLSRRCRRIEKKYPRQSRAVQSYLTELHRCEADDSPDLDLAAGLTGRMLAEIFVCTEDLWSDELRHMGFFLGKFIYLMDAFEDYTSDRTTHSYNPWVLAFPQNLTEESVLPILTMMMAEVTRAFERLPILQHADLLRNILYSGVWARYEEIKGDLYS